MRDSAAPWSLSDSGSVGAHDEAGRYSMMKNGAPSTDFVGREMQGARHQRKGAAETRQHAMLARHVVAAGRQRPGRWAAQHSGLAVEDDQVVEIAEAAGELARRRRGREVMAVRAEMRRQAFPGLGRLDRRIDELVGRAVARPAFGCLCHGPRLAQAGAPSRAVRRPPDSRRRRRDRCDILRPVGAYRDEGVAAP